MPIYLKKMPDGTVEAFGDLASLDGQSYDLAITVAQWETANFGAHLEGGEIVLGPGENSLAEAVREDRDALLVRNCDSITALRWATMSTELRERWKAYRQNLLDIPQTDGFPWDGVNVPWPTKPE